MGIAATNSIGYSEQGSYSAAVTSAARTAASIAGAESNTDETPEEAAAEKVASEENAINSAVQQTASDSAADNGNESQEEKDKDAKNLDNIKKAVADINKHAYGTEAVFGIHEATNRVTIKIVDKKTHDVIKEIPPEKTLDAIAKAWELAGILVDEKR